LINISNSSATNPNTMKGLWEGHYTYNKKSIQEKIGFDKTLFKINIERFENNKFSGSVEDDTTTGGTPGRGEITGNLNGDKVTFIKNMPVQVVFNRKGVIIDQNKKQRPIYYNGQISNDGNIITGTWKFKFGFIMNSLILLLALPTSGKWQMAKSANS
jgi:hypothetical protein